MPRADIFEGGRLAQVELIERAALSRGSLTYPSMNDTMPLVICRTSVGHLMRIRAISRGPVPRKVA